ncbi:hypothetical protein HWV62_27460 [Athelia sp. TMB]|nr:hypothetical protein HWV62_27460 [Athelia sp. TMB]
MSDLAVVEVWGGSSDGTISPAEHGGSARTSIDQPGSARSRGTASPSPASPTATRARTRLRAVDAGCDSYQREEDVPLQRAHREHRRVPKLLRGSDLRVTAQLPHAPEYTPHPDWLEPTPSSRDVHQGSGYYLHQWSRPRLAIAHKLRKMFYKDIVLTLLSLERR